MDKKVNANHLPNYEQPYPIIREILKKKLVMKRIPKESQHSESNVEQNNINGKSAKRIKSDANINRREERPGTSRTSARSKPSSGGSIKMITTQTSLRPRTNSHGDKSEVDKRSDNNIEISPDQLQQYEKIFLKNILIKEGFKTKLDKKKLNTFSIWFNCVENQFMRGRVQDEKKKNIIKKFCKKDDVFKMNILERNRIVRSGMDKVKEVCFGAFEPEFAKFVNSAEYHNACNYCRKFYYVEKKRKS